MITTGEDARPLPLIGQAVGQAQASLTRLLTGILAGTGTSHPVLAASAKVTGPMLATIDRADLDTTVRTLEKITRLASDTEGNR